jgi:chromosome partitioning protein
MLKISGPMDYRRIVILNPKGGSGKSTLSVNLSGYLAVTDHKVVLIDLDPQGSSSHWLGKRPVGSPPIHSAFVDTKPGERINLFVSLPGDTDIVVIDIPATLTRKENEDITLGSHAIIIPVMQPELDIHASSQLIANLLLIARFSQKNLRLVIVANRVKGRTIGFMHLMKFLNQLTVPMIGMIRDIQNYASTVRKGISIHEMQVSRVAKDLKTWEPITRWLEETRVAPLSEQDLLLKPREEMLTPIRNPLWKPIMVAAVILISITAFSLHFVSGLA